MVDFNLIQNSWLEDERLNNLLGCVENAAQIGNTNQADKIIFCKIHDCW